MVVQSGGHGGDNLPKAQAVKDATMGWNIHQYLGKGKTILHFNGSYHSNNNEGTAWYVKKYHPDVKIGNITTVTQSDLSKLDDEYKALGDFIIVVNENVTRTH